MNRSQLATLLSWAGEDGLHGRKRLQKVVYFLQKAGCPLDCHYTLHFFGPYSRDVADICDEMVMAGLLEESSSPIPGGEKYTYNLTPWTRSLLEKSLDPHMQKYETLGKELISADMWTLELGSTILYFLGEGNDWEKALSDACKYKKVLTNATISNKALELARQIYQQAA